MPELEKHQEAIDKSLKKLDDDSSKYHWMKEKKYATIFREIEHKLTGVLGVGQYDWVDRRVFDQVFDQSTLMAIYKLMQKDHIDTIEWPIARGKEAHVFHATSQSGPVAVKFFHTSNAVFKGLLQYIEGDPRFGGLRRRHRELVNVWVQKEHRNLMRMRKHGVRVPESLATHKNVLIMEYLGDETGPSPRLRDVIVDDPQKLYNDLLQQLRIIWHDAGLAHADFSDYNIMIHQGEAWIIDAGQSVVQNHPKAKEFLVRDITRLVQWAGRNGVDADLAEATLFVIQSDEEE
jgi:RIO kinase 1